jgi:Na+-translocating ferredoxin:NAD+ oxidoreductase RnfG subunit
MKKLNSIIYNKLLLQAEEAKEVGMDKLGSAIMNTLGSVPEEDSVQYNYEQLQDDVYQGLWRVATCVLKYHDLKSADATKVHEVLEGLASKLIKEVEQSLSVNNTQIGPLEDKVPGES